MQLTPDKCFVGSYLKLGTEWNYQRSCISISRIVGIWNRLGLGFSGGVG